MKDKPYMSNCPYLTLGMTVILPEKEQLRGAKSMVTLKKMGVKK